MVTRIVFTVLTLLIALGLAAYLIFDMYTVLDKENEIKRVEAKVIHKLELIREAEEGYQKLYGGYTNNWDSLRNFIKNDRFPIVEVKETIITLEYGADSVVIERDTIDYVNVVDSLYSEADLKALNLDRIQYVPNPLTDTVQFALQVESIKRGNYYVDVIKVADTKPFDRRRTEANERRIRRPLQFGSLTEISTAGNWE